LGQRLDVGLDRVLDLEVALGHDAQLPIVLRQQGALEAADGADDLRLGDAGQGEASGIGGSGASLER
ncbi:MAG TPA: hypothetical protein VFH61_11225, partial [Thermoleophilia bacterium]|nr:hypothetical protein [Thermoleophilia bacterium]